VGIATWYNGYLLFLTHDPCLATSW